MRDKKNSTQMCKTQPRIKYQKFNNGDTDCLGCWVDKIKSRSTIIITFPTRREKSETLKPDYYVLC